MRRKAWVALAALVSLAGWAPAGPAVALAQPTATPGAEAPEAVPGEEVCTITDPRLAELSGIVAVDDGYIVVNDSQEFLDRKPIFLLDQSCNVVDQIPFPTNPLDPEDLALDRENDVLWVGDTGDNAAGGLAEGGSTRPTVALWRVDLAGDRTPVIHRFVYPDGQPRDAEALVLDGDGNPVIITKHVGAAELYRPTDFIPNNPPEQGVPLEKLGEFTPPETGSEHPFLPPAAASRVVTGGANAPDGSTVVLRTYTDALEFDVTDGDVVAAITEGEPRVTPLPGEPMGEAISYTVGGERFVTVSDAPPVEVDLGEAFVPRILAYTPTEPPPPSPTAEPGPVDDGASGGGSFFSLNPDTIMLVIGAVGVLGLVMVVIGVVGIVRARRRAASAYDDDDEGVPSQTRGVASVAAAAPVAAAAAVPAGGSGTVYGGGGGAGTVYGAGAGGEGTVYGGGGGSGTYGAARVPAPSPPGDDAVAGDWEPEAEQPGVYRSGGVYQAGQYGDDGYGSEYDDAGAYQAAGYAEPEGYGEYEAGAYRADQEVDDYYDDPDYSYEFRRPGQPERY